MVAEECIPSRDKAPYDVVEHDKRTTWSMLRRNAHSAWEPLRRNAVDGDAKNMRTTCI